MTFMPGRQAELGHAPQDQRLVGGLLRVLAEDDDPARVERAVDVVVPAVHVQRVLGERARGRPPAPSSSTCRARGSTARRRRRRPGPTCS